MSWAVPKGPSLDPARKALAMKVEDHPLGYGRFEGNIPAGNYGGGSVMLWDTGTYEVIGEPGAQGQLERGDFKFELHGAKLNGSFAIVRMKRAAKGNEWLLIKKKDEHAAADYDIDRFAWSVSTKRTQDEIAAGGASPRLSELKGARKAEPPGDVSPMLATAVTKPPVGKQWLYEIKWDGVRALCEIKDGAVTMTSRRGNRCEQQYPEFKDLAKQVNAKTALLDGEICVLDAEGRARFHNIQPRISANKSAVPRLAQTAPAVLFVFDILFADGYDLRGVALEERKEVLHAVLQPSDRVRLSESFDAGGNQIFEAARQMGLEGILAKDRGSTYEASRSSHWQKIKVVSEQEFVIAGFTRGEREYFGALVLAVREDGKFRHAGQVGTGFDNKSMRMIYERLQPLVIKTSSLEPKPKIRGVIWVKPEVVCQVRFLEWTPDRILRAPVFVALREDKTPEEAVRETPIEPPENGASLLHLQVNPQAKEAAVDVDGHPLKFTNLGKVFFPKDGWKKRDLLGFYDNVSTWLLPHLNNRPLSLKRYPNGIEDDYFFQKNASTHFPDWLRCEPISEHGGTKLNKYPLANDRASLLYLVNLGCIDHNPWMSRVGNLDHPDWMLLDLDPVETSFDRIVEAALLVREILAGLRLKGYPKTTGGDGMHIYVPLDPVYTYEQVRSFAEIVAHLAQDRAPNLFTTPRSVQKRTKERVYFDYLQIGTGKTISAPYVVRAYAGAPVATPLDWQEVKPGLRPHDFRIDNSVERFKTIGDVFAPVLAGGQRLETALELLGRESNKKKAVKGKSK